MEQIISALRHGGVTQRNALAGERKSRPVRKATLIKGLLATLLGVLALGLNPALVGAQSTLEIGDTATLAAKGSAIILPVTVTCNAGSGSGSLNVQATQRSGNGITQGSGFSNEVVCDGTPHTINVLIQAQNRPFKKGPAVAQASFFFCDEFGCQNASNSQEIAIVR